MSEVWKASMPHITGLVEDLRKSDPAQTDALLQKGGVTIDVTNFTLTLDSKVTRHTYLAQSRGDFCPSPDQCSDDE
jgi:hypothetical protein